MSGEESQQLAERLQANQPFIMVYLLAAEEMESERPHPGWLLELAGEEVGIGLLHLKTVIDCLDAN